MFGASGNSVEALRADVVFNTDLGKFRGEIGQIERVYDQTIGGMSTEALRLSVAQEKVARAIKRTGPESLSTKQATLALRREMEALATSSTRAERAVDRETRSVDRFSRSSRAGSGAARGLARAVGFAAASFLGGAGLVYGLRSVLGAAKESELVLGQTKLAVRAAGLEWEKYANQIQGAIAQQSRLGFDDEELFKSFSVFVTRTKDVTEALRLNALATDVARGRYISLQAAQQIVLKASLGQSGQLRRLGIDVAKGASAIELITKLTDTYGGRAAGALGTATASQERLNVSLENSREIIGSGLTPIVADLADQVSDYLDDAGRQEELQRRVNEGVKDGIAIARGLAGGLRQIRSAVEPVVDGLGGLENVARLAVTAFALSKLRAIAIGIRGIGRASAVAAVEVNALAAAEARAAAAGGAGAAGSLARGRVAAAGRVALAGTFGAPGLAVAGGILTYNAVSGTASQAAGGFGEPTGKTQDGRLVYRRNGKLYVRGAGPGASSDSISVRAGSGAPIVLYALEAGPSAGLASRPDEGDRATPDGTTRGPRAGASTSRPGGGVRFDRDLSATVRGRAIQLGLLKADDSAGLGDDVNANRAAAAYYYAGLSTVKEGTRAYNEIYAQYVSFHRAELAAIDQVDGEKERQRNAVQARREKDAKASAAALEKSMAAQRAQVARDYRANQLAHEWAPNNPNLRRRRKSSSTRSDLSFEDMVAVGQASFAAYGSNIGAVLSRQDVRGTVGGLEAGAITTQMLAELRTQTRALTAPRAPSPIDVAHVGARNGLD